MAKNSDRPPPPLSGIAGVKQTCVERSLRRSTLKRKYIENKFLTADVCRMISIIWCMHFAHKYPMQCSTAATRVLWQVRINFSLLYVHKYGFIILCG